MLLKSIIYLTRLPLCANNNTVALCPLSWLIARSRWANHYMIWPFYRTSSRKSIVSNIHYRVTATTNSSLCCNSWQPCQCFSSHLQVAGVTTTCYVLQEPGKHSQCTQFTYMFPNHVIKSINMLFFKDRSWAQKY